jgi:hypothetical protein
MRRVLPGIALILLLPGAVRAGDLGAALPDGRLASLRVPSGRGLFDSGPVQRALERLREAGALAELDQGRAALRAATGSDPAEWLDTLLGGELQAAVYAGRPSRLAPEGAAGPRLLLAAARLRDPQAGQRALDALLAVMDGDPANDVRRNSYRDVPWARVNRKLVVACRDDVLLLGNDDDLLALALDRLLDGAAPAEAAPQGAGLLAFRLDPEVLRPGDWRPAAGEARRALGKRIANPLGNLLLGGLLAGDGPVSGWLDGEADGLELHLSLPPAPAGAPAAWFPPGEPGFAVPVSQQTLAVLAVRRDLADWWRQRESLMGEESQPQLAKTDETLSLLFMGGSPAEDVFAALREELALVVDRQVFADGDAPDLKLPAACLVARLKDPQSFGPSVAVAFQTLVGFLNTERAQERRQPFLLDAVEHEGALVRAARLLPARDGQPPGTDANASPAVAVHDDWLLVGTSLEQVLRLLDALEQGALRPVKGAHLALQVDGARALQLARDNREVLVAKSILEDGLAAVDAGRHIDDLLALLGELSSLDLAVTPGPQSLDVSLHLSLAGRAP